MDYQPILNQFGEIIELILPMSITLGLSKWVVCFILDAVFDRRRKETY